MPKVLLTATLGSPGGALPREPFLRGRSARRRMRDPEALEPLDRPAGIAITQCVRRPARGRRALQAGLPTRRRRVPAGAPEAKASGRMRRDRPDPLTRRPE